MYIKRREIVLDLYYGKFYKINYWYIKIMGEFNKCNIDW